MGGIALASTAKPVGWQQQHGICNVPNHPNTHLTPLSAPSRCNTLSVWICRLVFIKLSAAAMGFALLIAPTRPQKTAAATLEVGRLCLSSMRDVIRHG
jgi:hypothetical protein